MDNNVNSRYPLAGGMEERVDAWAESKHKIITIWDKIIAETLQSWYPKLSEKELDICDCIFSTMWDLNSGNSAMYDEPVARLVGNNIFANKKEIDNVIKNLVSASVLEAKQEIWLFGGTKKSLRVLAFAEEDLYKQLISASNENFDRLLMPILS